MKAQKKKKLGIVFIYFFKLNSYFIFVWSRSGVAEVHAEAVGDLPFTVRDGGRAGGQRSRAGLTVFGEEHRGEVHTVAGLQQTIPGAQDAAHTPAGYSMTEWKQHASFRTAHCWWQPWVFDERSKVLVVFQMCPSGIKSSHPSWGNWFGRKFRSASSTSVFSTAFQTTAASWRNTTLYGANSSSCYEICFVSRIHLTCSHFYFVFVGENGFVCVPGDQGDRGIWKVSEGPGVPAGRLHRPAQIRPRRQLSLRQQEMQRCHCGGPQTYDLQDAQNCKSMWPRANLVNKLIDCCFIWRGDSVWRVCERVMGFLVAGII